MYTVNFGNKYMLYCSVIELIRNLCCSHAIQPVSIKVICYVCSNIQGRNVSAALSAQPHSGAARSKVRGKRTFGSHVDNPV